MTTPIAKGQLLQLQMIEQWFDTNVTLMRNAVIAGIAINERPSMNVSYPFMAYLFDCALITTTPDDRSLFMGCELNCVDETAFVWEVA